MKKEWGFSVSHVDASGRVLTDEQFRRGTEVRYEDNKELFADAAFEFDPDYAAKKRAQVRYERAAKRLEKLKGEEARVREELRKMP